MTTAPREYYSTYTRARACSVAARCVGGRSGVKAAGNAAIVTRTFNGPARIVFEAWTEPELLKRWWAPKSAGAGCRVGCPRRSRNWTSFSSPCERAWDGREVGDPAVARLALPALPHERRSPGGRWVAAGARGLNRATEPRRSRRDGGDCAAHFDGSHALSARSRGRFLD